MDLRLNKFISDSGFCSRREADALIEAGRVTLNGKTASLGCRVGAGDKVKVNGHLIESDSVDIVYLALNKPRGVVSTTDPAEPNNIVDFVNYKSRIFNIGRLDKMSEGLILLTNDGNIVNKILRAANNHDKEYEVKVDKPITADFLKRMASGIPILGTVTKRCQIKQEGVSSFRIILTQGLNRQIRRMCEFLGYEVKRLRRVRIMNIHLGKLPLGQWRELTPQEIEVLMRSLDTSDGSEKASQGAGAGKSKDSDKSKGGKTRSNTGKPNTYKSEKGSSKKNNHKSSANRSTFSSKQKSTQRRKK